METINPHIHKVRLYRVHSLTKRNGNHFIQKRNIGVFARVHSLTKRNGNAKNDRFYIKPYFVHSLTKRNGN